jgi:hypothetical protein
MGRFLSAGQEPEGQTGGQMDREAPKQKEPVSLAGSSLPESTSPIRRAKVFVF